MICRFCLKSLPKEREEAILTFDLDATCVECSKVQIPKVYMSYEHKTAGTLFVVPNNPDGSLDHEKIRQADRAFKRKR